MSNNSDTSETNREVLRQRYTRNSIFWNEGKMLLHKNGIILIDDGTFIVYPNFIRKGKKIVTTSLQHALDYLFNVEIEGDQ